MLFIFSEYFRVIPLQSWFHIGKSQEVYSKEWKCQYRPKYGRENGQKLKY